MLEPAQIPFVADALAISYSIDVDGGRQEISAVSMGNPHAVLIVDNVDLAEVNHLGPLIESHPRFPRRTNVGFMQIEDEHRIRLRVYERGAGETLACGTGACAAVVAGCIQGRLQSPVTVSLPGGELVIQWNGSHNPVCMTGPATHVFEGQIEL